MICLTVPEALTLLVIIFCAAAWAVGRLYRSGLQRMNNELTRARRDPVTGLPTRHLFERLAPPHLTTCNVVGMLDLDRFKAINDTHGHAAGDEILHTVASRLVDDLGEGALISRLGGDEFAFLATFHPRDPRPQLELLLAILTQPVDVPGVGPLRCGASLGLAYLATLPSPTPNLREALAAADASMYEAKARGGGWRLYDPRTDPVRPLRQIESAPRRRYRHHGPQACNRRPVATQRP